MACSLKVLFSSCKCTSWAKPQDWNGAVLWILWKTLKFYKLYHVSTSSPFKVWPTYLSVVFEWDSGVIGLIKDALQQLRPVTCNTALRTQSVVLRRAARRRGRAGAQYGGLQGKTSIGQENKVAGSLPLIMSLLRMTSKAPQFRLAFKWKPKRPSEESTVCKD